DFRLSLFPFDDPPTTEIYPLSLHDALPILSVIDLYIIGTAKRRSGDVCRPMSIVLHRHYVFLLAPRRAYGDLLLIGRRAPYFDRSEEHTSELQSRENLVCRLLLEKKKNTHV